jgi:branched-chain amino acid transport system permease protein
MLLVSGERGSRVTLILQAVILGVLTGSIYALMASGLTLVFGVMEVINIAQGIFVIAGGYLSATLEQYFHIDLFAGLLITMPAMFLFGLGVEWVALRPLRGDRVALSILATYGVALVVEGGLGFVYSTDLVQLHAWYEDASVQIGSFYLPAIYLFACALCVLLLAALFLLLSYTTFGRSLRASMQDRTAAELIGINVERVSTITFGLGTALAAAGGMAYGATNTFNPASSYDLISRLLVIIVLGGMGNIWGALLASVLILVVGDVTAVVTSPVWSSTIIFVLLLGLLVFRPQGLSDLGGRRDQ